MLFNCVGCGSRGSIGYFRFPKDAYEKKIWLEKCGVHTSTPIARDARLCTAHFKPDDIHYGYHLYRLKKHAIPSIKVDLNKIHRPRQRKRWCYVCGWTYAESFHVIPKDEKMCKAWLQNLGITFGDFNPTRTSDLYLCSSHFSASDILGHPYSLSRRLRRGAMPLAISQNARNNQTGQSTSSSKTKDSEQLSENSEVVNVSTDLTGKKGSDQSTTDMNKDIVSLTISNLTSKGVEDSNVSTDLAEKKRSDQSTNSSKKEIATRAITNSPSKDVQDPSIFECKLEKKKERVRRLKERKTQLKKELLECRDWVFYLHEMVEKKDKRIRRLKDKKKRIKEESTCHLAFLDELLKEQTVTEEVKTRIEEFKQNLGNPAERL